MSKPENIIAIEDKAFGFQVISGVCFFALCFIGILSNDIPIWVIAVFGTVSLMSAIFSYILNGIAGRLR